MPRTFEFKLPGISCNSCTNSIQTLLTECKDLKIQHFHVSLDQSASITIDDKGKSDQEVISILEDLLLPWDPQHQSTIISREEGSAIELTIIPKKKKNLLLRILQSHWFKAALGLAGGAALLGLMLSGVGIPLFAMYLITCASSLLTLYIGWESYYQAFNKLFRTGSLTMDALFTVSTLAAIGISIASFFVPGLSMMFDAALLIFGFRHLGRGIEESIKQKVFSTLKFRDRAPKYAELETETGIETKDIETLKVGDVIIIPPGGTIPLDGICLDETSAIYDTIITGKTLPHTIQKGEALLAGIKAAGQPLRLCVTANSANSYLAKLDREIAQADASKAPIETTASKILQYFIPAVILTALAAGIVLSFFFPPLIAVQCGIAVLVSACPCTLGLIVPLAVRIGITKAAENNAVFKSHESLESAHQIDTVVFDLNGTLTLGEPRVEQVKILSNERLLPVFAALEKNSKHPIAIAIANHIEKTHRDCDTELSNIDSRNYCGIQAIYKNKNICIGNANMMKKNDLNISKIAINRNESLAEHVIYLAYNNEAVGYILLRDPLRPDAKATIDELKRMGKQVHICTGADKKTAYKYAHFLEIPRNCVSVACVGSSDSTNQVSKTHYIESLQNEGRKVAMIGDGGNDAVAFAKSDLAIAIKSSSSDEVTVENADVTFKDTSLLPIIVAFEVANQTISNIKQNLGISISYNVLALCLIGGVLIGLGFALHPAVGVALMVAGACIALGNAYRFRQQKLGHVEHAKSIVETQALDETSTVRLGKGLGVDETPEVNYGTRDPAGSLGMTGLVDYDKKCLIHPKDSILQEYEQQPAAGFGKYNS